MAASAGGGLVLPTAHPHGGGGVPPPAAPTGTGSRRGQRRPGVLGEPGDLFEDSVLGVIPATIDPPREGGGALPVRPETGGGLAAAQPDAGSVE